MRDHRQTGRTTRMIQRARALAMNGRAVYVVAACHSEVLRLRAIIATWPEGPMGVVVDTAGYLGLDWRLLTIPGAHPNCIVLVDHLAIKEQFGKVFRELHAYDLDNGGTE